MVGPEAFGAVVGGGEVRDDVAGCVVDLRGVVEDQLALAGDSFGRGLVCVVEDLGEGRVMLSGGGA